MLDQLPPELILNLLCILRDAYDGARSSVLVISNLAQTCRSVRNITIWWSSPQSHSEKGRNALLEFKDHDVVLSSASIVGVIPAYCRKLGEISTICPNRARYCPEGEYFTGLQLCRACEAKYFPKISLTMLEKYLIIHDREKKVLDQLDQYRLQVKSSKDLQKDGEIQIFRWRDVEKLISTGVIPRNMSIERSSFRKTSGEHCAFFGNTWEEDWEVEYHESFIRCHLEQLSMWRDIEDHWNPQRAALSPAQTELIQFKEFCYQFDPSFR
jgi:hypothetical protein